MSNKVKKSVFASHRGVHSEFGDFDVLHRSSPTYRSNKNSVFHKVLNLVLHFPLFAKQFPFFILVHFLLYGSDESEVWLKGRARSLSRLSGRGSKPLQV